MAKCILALRVLLTSPFYLQIMRYGPAQCTAAVKKGLPFSTSSRLTAEWDSSFLCIKPFVVHISSTASFYLFVISCCPFYYLSTFAWLDHKSCYQEKDQSSYLVPKIPLELYSSVDNSMHLTSCLSFIYMSNIAWAKSEPKSSTFA